MGTGSQKFLFDTDASTGQYGQPIVPEPALARKTDPEPSHVAAANILTKLSQLHVIFLNVLKNSDMAKTAQEIAADAYPINESIRSAKEALKHRETLRKRARELFDAGYISKQGDRICQVTGNRASVYKLTEKGRVA